MRERGGQNSPKSPSSMQRAADGTDEPSLTPIKHQSTSLRNKSNNVVSNDMPSVSEEMSTIQGGANHESKQLLNGMSSSNLSVNQLSEAPTMTMMGPHVPSTKSVNFLLDYLLNNSKGGGFITNNNNNNSKLDVSNLAALAALVDLRDNNDGVGTTALNSPIDPNSCSNNNNNNESMLKNLLIDLVSPPLVVSSQFDLSSAGSSVEHLELQLNYQVNDANSPYGGVVGQFGSSGGFGNSNTLNASGRPQIDSTSFNINFGNGQTNLNNKKQVNEQIMRACMAYLDYINKKHNRERRIQIIRNKVSGFVLLTIVFLLIFGLTLVMTFFLARAFTKMINKASPSTSLTMSEGEVASDGSSNEFIVDGFLPYEADESGGVSGGGGGGGGVAPIVVINSSSTNSPFGLNQGLVTGILQSETMVTASARPNHLNMTHEQQSIDQIWRALRQTLRDMIKKTNITRSGLEKLSPYLTRMLNSTISESIQNASSNRLNRKLVDNQEEDTEEHYIEMIDELN